MTGALVRWGACAALLVVVAGGAGCGRAAQTHTAPAPIIRDSSALGDTSVVVARGQYAPGDTSLIAAVARTIADSAIVSVRLDPQRLPPELDGSRTVPTRADVKLDPGGAIDHVKSLLDVTIREPDRRRMFALCGDPSLGCPKERFMMVVLGTPRQGGPQLPRLARPMETKPGYWTVRVVATDMRPFGESTEVLDYVFEKRASGWVFIRRVGLFQMD